jgi:hypothetical protein
MIEGAAVRWKLVGLGFREDFCKIAILLGDFRRGFLDSSIDGRQKFRERGDGVEMEKIKLIVRPDFTSKADLWRRTRRLWLRRMARRMSLFCLFAFFGSHVVERRDLIGREFRFCRF